MNLGLKLYGNNKIENVLSFFLNNLDDAMCAWIQQFHFRNYSQRGLDELKRAIGRKK